MRTPHRTKRRTSNNTLLLVALTLSLYAPGALRSRSVGALTTVQVCQNKDCCRRFQGKSSLVQVLQDLTNSSSTTTPSLDAANSNDATTNQVVVEATGCLSQCDLGPNVQVNDSKVQNGVLTPLHAVALLQGRSGLDFAPAFINVVMALETAQEAASFSEKQRLLTAVIQSLDPRPELRTSRARIHAQTLRAQTYLEAGQYEAALRDAEELVGELAVHAALVHRVAADAHESLRHYADAAREWHQVAKCDPKFQTKANKQIQRLLQLQDELLL